MIQRFLIIFLTLYGICEPEEMEAIIGQFPYLASIWYLNIYCCSGTIIDKRHILTTASCVYFASNFDFTVIVGTDQSADLQKRKFQVSHIHMYHRSKETYRILLLSPWENDIAVLRLAENLIFSPTVRPIRFISQADINLSSCVTPGYYLVNPAQNGRTMTVKWSSVTTVPNEQCKPYKLLRNEHCALIESPSTNKMGCPMSCNNVVVGVISRSDGVNKGIFLNLLPYLEFISDAIDVSKENIQYSEKLPIVAIWNKGNYACGGILLTRFHILTSSHCVRNATKIDLRAIAEVPQILPRNRVIKWLLIDQKINVPCSRFEQVAVLTIRPTPEWHVNMDIVFPDTASVPTTSRICNGFRWHRAYTVQEETLMQLVRTKEMILSNEECQSFGVELQMDQFCTRSSYSRARSNSESIGTPIMCNEWIPAIMVPTISTSSAPPDISTFLKITNYKDALLAFIRLFDDYNEIYDFMVDN